MTDEMQEWEEVGGTHNEELVVEAKCAVCAGIGVDRKADHVVGSFLGGFSLGYCQEHFEADIEPYGIMVASCVGLTPGKVSKEIRPILRNTLRFFKKTKRQFWADVSEFEREYEAAEQAYYQDLLSKAIKAGEAAGGEEEE